MNLRERANRKRGERHRPRDGRGWSLMQGTCPDCGKKRYATRGDAKRAARQSHGGRARVCKCGEWWHLTSQDAETAARYREM